MVNTGVDRFWKDYEQIFTALSFASDDDTTRSYFKKVFYVNAPEDAETFWEDISHDSIRQPNELFHRFNLTRNDWSIANLRIKLVSNANNTDSEVFDDYVYLPDVHTSTYDLVSSGISSTSGATRYFIIDY